MHIYLLCPGAVLKWIQLDSTDPICHCQYNMPPQFMRLYRSYLPCDEWSFLVPLIGGIYCQLGDYRYIYIYITYDLLREPETAIDVILRILGFFLSSSFTGWIYPLKTNKHGHSKILQYIDFLSKKASFWVSDTIKKKTGNVQRVPARVFSSTLLWGWPLKAVWLDAIQRSSPWEKFQRWQNWSVPRD